MSRPASAIFFIGAPGEGFANRRIVAAAPKGVAPLECEGGKAFWMAGESRRIRLEHLTNVLRAGSPKGRSFAIHFSQQGAREPDCKHVCHTLVNTVFADQMQPRTVAEIPRFSFEQVPA